MSDITKLQESLTYKRKNFWEEYSKEEHKSAMDFCEGYKKFLDIGKTERESVVETVRILEENGFENIDGNPKGNKVYRTFKGKNVAIALIGNNDVKNGVNVVASHIDSPRVDLKQSPLYQDSETKLGMMKTHYYGGVKKYQWMSTPLALHGVVIKDNGEAVNISIGENDDEPVFIMPDILPHLGRKVQYSKKIGKAVAADNMKLIFNSIPYIAENEEDKKKIKEAVKLQALVLLNEKYGIKENNFLSAELQLVPVSKARDVGLDRSFLAAYGQDDRVCAYTSLKAILELEADNIEKTSVVYFADKEEIGSDGNTGAKSIFIYDFIADILKHNKEDYDSYTLRKTILKTQILSSDVNAAINPNYPSVHEPQNAVHAGFGVSLTKYTGAGGKGGSNDAHSEFTSKIMRIFDEEKVNWQMGALGKVDEGGGGTIAKLLAEKGSDVIDCGTGILGMHSPHEVTSKADIYSTYKAYLAFLKKA